MHTSQVVSLFTRFSLLVAVPGVHWGAFFFAICAILAFIVAFVCVALAHFAAIGENSQADVSALWCDLNKCTNVGLVSLKMQTLTSWLYGPVCVCAHSGFWLRGVPDMCKTKTSAGIRGGFLLRMAF